MTTAAAVEGSRRGPWRTAAYWGRRAVMMEVWGYVSILRWVLRRPKVPAGAVGFTYHQPVIVLVIAFIVVSAVELVVLDLLLRRWPSVRIAVLVLSLWGLVWMFGLLFGLLTRPHAVGPDGIRVRSGAEVDVPLPWDVVGDVVRRKHVEQGKEPLVTVDEQGGRTLHLRVQHETNLEIALTRPVTARMPQGARTVTRLRVFADDPDGFVREAARHRAAAPDRSPG